MTTLAPRYSINRHLITITPKQPFLDWLLSVDPNPPENPSLAELRDDSEAFLIPDNVAEETKDAIKLVEKNWKMFFEHCLSGWITDESLWPKISLKMFREWFDIEYRSMVWDLGGEPLAVEDWDSDEDDEPTFH